jgi:hypothetical protein
VDTINDKYTRDVIQCKSWPFGAVCVTVVVSASLQNPVRKSEQGFNELFMTFTASAKTWKFVI